MKITYIIIAILFTVNLYSQNKPNSVKDYGVLINTRYDTTEKKLILSWETDTNTYKYRIYSKSIKDTAFGNYKYEISGKINHIELDYIDGKETEYMIERDAWNYWAYGYILAGMNIKPVHYRGSILIVVDENVYDSLTNEIEILKDNLVGDGWVPKLILSPRAEEFDSEKVITLKNKIDDVYKSDQELKSLLLIGRVPVPYSGSFAVDGHSPDHDGAWPTDIFYSIFEGKWTDTINNIKSNNPRINNLPSDGKFDQLIIPADAKLQTGRVDFFKLNSIKKSEIDLLKNYLNKNDKFRNHKIEIKDSAIINDYFGLDYKEGFAANGWMNFSSILSFNNISTEQLRYASRNNNYLFAYACGAGSYNSVSQSLYTDDLDSVKYGVAFTLLFGSYNGDWDSEDNVLRASLASEPLGLATMWAGRPYWFLHHLGLGYNIGYSALLSQNSRADIYLANSPFARRFNHISLLGDPSLRSHYPSSVDTVIAVNNNGIIEVEWNDSSKNVNDVYNIYRSNSKHGKYSLLSDNFTDSMNFKDSLPMPGVNYYMVRRQIRQTTASGSYYNLSTGKISNPVFSPKLNDNEYIRVFPNPAFDIINIAFDFQQTGLYDDIQLYDISGRLIRKYSANEIQIEYNIASIKIIDGIDDSLPSGIYFLRINFDDRTIIKKVILIKQN